MIYSIAKGTKCIWGVGDLMKLKMQNKINGIIENDRIFLTIEFFICSEKKYAIKVYSSILYTLTTM